jgi:hypothetical protein
MQQILPDYWENFLAVLLAFGVLALIIERALYQIFDAKIWAKVEAFVDEQVGGDHADLKPWISSGVAIVIVFKLRLDMIGMVFSADEPHNLSMFVTGLFVAGGSTGVYKFLRRARKLKDAISEQKIAEAQLPAAKAD